MRLRRCHYLVILLCLSATMAGAVARELPEITLHPGAEARIVPLDADSILGQHLVARVTPSGGDDLSLHLVARRGGGTFQELGSGEDTRIAPDVEEVALRLSVPQDQPAFDREVSISFYDADKSIVGRTDFRIRVAEGASRWIGYLVLLSGAALVGAVTLLLGNTIVHSRFLPPPKKIVQHMQPQRCGLAGTWRNDTREARNPLPQIQRALQPRARLQNWIRSNPLAFCLPGREYSEALLLDLTMPIQASLIRGRNLVQRIHDDPKRWEGQVLAVANRRGGVSFFAFPDSHGCAGGLRVEHRRTQNPVDEAMVRLSRHRRLVKRSRRTDHASNAWRLISV